MKIVGLVTEYNPFHNGHQYHIEKSLEVTGADAAIVVMTGNYVQRGTPAIMPKHLRTQVALEAGVSVVLELPVCYSTGSAEYFATGAISLFEKLGCIDSVCFGTECGDYDILNSIAHILVEEPIAYKERLKHYLKRGDSFPLARQKALKEYQNDNTLDQILEQPNNILGIEYLKTLYQTNSTITPYVIQRKEADYHDMELGSTYSSASAIRRLLAFSGNTVHVDADMEYDEPILTDILTRLEEQVPKTCIHLLEENHRIRYPIYSNDFSLLLKYKLLTETRDSLLQYVDITKELANRIINHVNNFISFEQFCDLLKTRAFTYTRISRALLHILLDIKKESMTSYSSHGYHAYAHVLGFREDAISVLTTISATSTIPIITKLTATDALDQLGLQMLQQDIHASNLYETVITDKFKYPFINEYEQSVVKI
ncbi:MAG: nucleotidyltransferase [Lachnospiraceae bacterium]